jgi:hypothetical protein
MSEAKAGAKQLPSPQTPQQQAIPTQIDLAQKGIGALDNIARDNIRLTAELKEALSRASHLEGRVAELTAQNVRLRRDCQYYHQTATVMQAHWEQLHSHVERVHPTIPNLTPPESQEEPEIGAFPNLKALRSEPTAKAT